MTSSPSTIAGRPTSTPASAPAYRAERVARLGVTDGIRGERIVHELDGMRDQVAPQRLLATGEALWTAWCADPTRPAPTVLLGLDAGGIPPTMALGLASGLPYRLAWKLDLDLPHKRVFCEPHARRVEVFTYADFAGETVLIVDDEMTTGATAANLTVVLRSAGAQVAGIACLVEDLTGGARTRLAELGVPVCTLTSL